MKHSKFRWTDEERAKLEKHWLTMNNQGLVDMLERSWSSIYNQAVYKMGLDYKKRTELLYGSKLNKNFKFGTVTQLPITEGRKFFEGPLLDEDAPEFLFDKEGEDIEEDDEQPPNHIVLELKQDKEQAKLNKKIDRMCDMIVEQLEQINDNLATIIKLWS